MLDRKLRRTIEWAFYNYDANRQKALCKVEDCIDASLAHNANGVSSNAKHRNIMEDKTIRAVDNWEWRWCRVVEKTIGHFKDTGKDTLIKLRYFDKMRENDVCEKLYIEKTSYYGWINDILSYALSIAALHRLFTEKEL